MIFGGLAIIVIGMTLDPWLCVPGFYRVCLYRMNGGGTRAVLILGSFSLSSHRFGIFEKFWLIGHLTKKIWLSTSKAKLSRQNDCDLRRPGNHGHWNDFRPVALRPRLSAGLPLSDILCVSSFRWAGVGFFSFQGGSGSHQVAFFLTKVNITLKSLRALNVFVRWAYCLTMLFFLGMPVASLFGIGNQVLVKSLGISRAGV